jgi:class 3 adenylate cyclase
VNGGVPEVKYAESPGGLVAYQTLGEHSIDLLHIGNWHQSVEGIWELPTADRFYRRLASFARLVLVDKRGAGLSDPLTSPYAGGDFGPWVEEGVTDYLTVLDAIGSTNAVLLANFHGAAAAVALAAIHPQRVTAMILVDPVVKVLSSPDFPWGYSEEMRQAIADVSRRAWGEGMCSGSTPSYDGPGSVPSFARDESSHRWMARYERTSFPRGHMAAWWERWDYDLRPLLPLVQAPTLVMHHEGNVLYDPGAASHVASAIPGAVGSVSIPSLDLELWAPQPGVLADEIERFVTGAVGIPVGPIDRGFAVVLFTDLVESTRHAAAIGDQRWRELLTAHDDAVTRQVEQHRGRVIKRTGDGVVATFDAPARAVRCAEAIHADMRQLGVQVRAGLHAGEVEFVGPDIAGIAVHIAARVMGYAGAGEIVVSRTIKDLVIGSGLDFEDCGTHVLKGVPEEWQLFNVVT